MRALNMAGMAALCLSLAGCFGTGKVVREVEYKSIELPDHLLSNCHESAPPAIDQYVEADEKGREDLIINHSIQLHRDIQVCNSQIKNLRATYNRQKSHIESLKP